MLDKTRGHIDFVTEGVFIPLTVSASGAGGKNVVGTRYELSRQSVSMVWPDGRPKLVHNIRVEASRTGTTIWEGLPIVNIADLAYLYLTIAAEGGGYVLKDMPATYLNNQADLGVIPDLHPTQIDMERSYITAMRQTDKVAWLQLAFQ